jgi:dihydrodipicolinate synthase/N-acetylneuraminate lyase
MTKALQRPLRGIIPPLVTPLLDNDTLDLEGLKRLIDHTIAGGVHGVFVLGTTGEFASLSYRIRKELIEKTCELVNGRVPVLVGIADSAFIESLNLARIAEKSGASAVVITPPYYYTSGQPELTDFFSRLMAKMPLPLFVYNMPQHAKVSVDPETVKVAAEIPGIIGIKDSSGNLTYLNKVMHLLRDRTDFTFMIGPEEILAEFVLLGGHGGINGGANMFPKLYTGLYNAAVNRDFERIHVLREKVLQISSTLYGVGHYGSSYLKGIKCVLSIMGICSDFMAEPFRKFKVPEREKIIQHLKDLKYEELL